MTHPHKLLTVLGVIALVAGCNNRATPPPQPEPRPETTGQPAPHPQPQPPDPVTGTAGGVTTPGVILVFRVERDVVPVRPGGEARVKLLSMPKDADLTVTVEPSDSRLNAVVDKDVLTIRAGDNATGESVVTVRAGNETARVTVQVAAEKK